MEKFNIAPLGNMLRANRLSWYGHVERSSGWINRCRSIKVPRTKGPDPRTPGMKLYGAIEKPGNWWMQTHKTAPLRDIGCVTPRTVRLHVWKIRRKSGYEMMMMKFDTMLDPLMQPWTCNMGLPVGYSTCQIHWPSNGLMQNYYSFQPAALSILCYLAWGVLSFFEGLVRLGCSPCLILWGWQHQAVSNTGSPCFMLCCYCDFRFVCKPRMRSLPKEAYWAPLWISTERREPRVYGGWVCTMVLWGAYPSQHIMGNW